MLHPVEEGWVLLTFDLIQEFPGLLISAATVDKLGRKLSMSAMFFLCCIFLLPLVFHQPAGVTTGLLFGARICITSTFTVVYIYAPEVSHTQNMVFPCFKLKKYIFMIYDYWVTYWNEVYNFPLLFFVVDLLIPFHNYHILANIRIDLDIYSLKVHILLFNL